MIRPAQLVVVLWIAVTACAAQPLDNPWHEDFQQQIMSARPKIEARYADASRRAIEINAQHYGIKIELESPSGQKMSSFRSAAGSAVAEMLTADGIYLQLTDAIGTVYSSLHSRKPSRINIYRRGPYYIETHWLDILLTDPAGNEAPVKGEVILYSYPEKTHIGVILHVTGPISVKSARLICEFDADTCASRVPTESTTTGGINDFCLIKRAADGPSCALIYPVVRGVDEVALEKIDTGVRVSNYVYSEDGHASECALWKEGDRPAAYFEILPLPSSEISEFMEAEVDPLLSGAMIAQSGRTLGYDPIRGCYKVQTDNPGHFSYHYYEAPNDYEVATFSIANNTIPRKVYVLHETRNKPGSVECGVVLDDAGNTLPITVQTSKNFAGEKEEPFYNPNDTPFSETIFPLHLAAGERRSLTSLHLYQNWGLHPLKQFSSLGAWMDYYHMSTGVTETTCYVPFLFGGLNGVHIADLRPMSQQMWEKQPQHDNVAGHSFLRYQDNERWHYIEYAGTTFRSTGPNWADISMSYVSDDGRAKVTLDIFELPQTDELRNFIRMRIDFLQDIDILNGDFARNMRLLNISSWVQQLRYTTVAYGGPTGDPAITPIKLNDDFTLAGAPLPLENGFATIYPEKRGANAFVVRRFEGSIDGKSVSPGVSVIGQENGDTVLMLVPITEAKSVRAGDYIEADLFIMPYGGGTQDYGPAKKAAFDYGLNAPKVTGITRGTKISDFPTRIRVDEEGIAEFSITGGMNYIPIIIEGSSTYKCQRLYNMDAEKTLIDHAQKGERDGYQVFMADDGSFGWVFLAMTDGKEHRYRVE